MKKYILKLISCLLVLCMIIQPSYAAGIESGLRVYGWNVEAYQKQVCKVPGFSNAHCLNGDPNINYPNTEVSDLAYYVQVLSGSRWGSHDWTSGLSYSETALYNAYTCLYNHFNVGKSSSADSTNCITVTAEQYSNIKSQLSTLGFNVDDRQSWSDYYGTYSYLYVKSDVYVAVPNSYSSFVRSAVAYVVDELNSYYLSKLSIVEYINNLQENTQYGYSLAGLVFCNTNGKQIICLPETSNDSSDTTVIVTPTDLTTVEQWLEQIHDSINVMNNNIIEGVDELFTINDTLFSLGSSLNTIANLMDDLTTGFASFSVEFTDYFESLGEVFIINNSNKLYSSTWFTRDSDQAVNNVRVPTLSGTDTNIHVHGFSNDIDGRVEFTSDDDIIVYPSTGTSFNQSYISVGNDVVELPYFVSGTDVPNPSFVVPDDYIQYEFIRTSSVINIASLYNYCANGSFKFTPYSSSTFSLFYQVINYNTSNGQIVLTYNGSYPVYFDLYYSGSRYWTAINSSSSFRVSSGVNYSSSWSISGSYVNYVCNDSSVSLYASPISGSPRGTGQSSFNSSGITIDIYYFSINGNGIYHNYIPCSNSSGIFGLFDVTSNTFYPCNTSGVTSGYNSISSVISSSEKIYYPTRYLYRDFDTGTWYGVLDGGQMWEFPEGSQAILESNFTSEVVSSTDFVPKVGTYQYVFGSSKPIRFNTAQDAEFFEWFYSWANALTDQISELDSMSNQDIYYLDEDNDLESIADDSLGAFTKFVKFFFKGFTGLMASSTDIDEIVPEGGAWS